MSLIFIAGHAASGTSLLGTYLNEHEKILCGPGTGIFAHPVVWSTGRSWNDIARPFLESRGRGKLPNACPLIRSYHIEALPHFFLKKAEFREITSRAASIEELAERFFELRLLGENKSLWIDRTPQNLFALADMLEHRAEARAIIVTRHPLDTIVTLMETGLSFKESAKTWTAECALAQHLLDTHTDRILHVRGEDLVDDLAGTLCSVVRWLGLDPETLESPPPLGGLVDAVRDDLPPLHKNDGPFASKSLRLDGVGIWKQRLSPGGVQHFLHLRTRDEITALHAGLQRQWARDVMQALGYPDVECSPASVKLSEEDQRLRTLSGKFFNRFSSCQSPKPAPPTRRFLFFKRPAMKTSESDSETVFAAPTDELEPACEGSESEPVPGVYDVVCLIASHRRHAVLWRAVHSILSFSGNVRVAVAVVVSDKTDFDLVEILAGELDNVFVTTHPNRPLGDKWAAGVAYARKFDPKSLLIMGSDDLVTRGYVPEAFRLTDEGRGSEGFGFDLVGVREWFLYDADKNSASARRLWKLAYDLSRKGQNLGAGRLYARSALERLDWRIFDTKLNSSLDRFGYERIMKIGGLIHDVPVDHGGILSLKGSWDAINPTDQLLCSPTVEVEPLDFQKAAFIEKHFGLSEKDFIPFEPEESPFVNIFQSQSSSR